MIRRYDMSRSDNAPVSSRCMMPISGSSGEFWVYTNVTVRAVSLTPISVPFGGVLEVDHCSFGGKRFKVMYSNMPDNPSFVEFSFIIQ